MAVSALGASELEAPSLTTRLYRGAAVVDLQVSVHNRARAARDLQVRGSLGHAGRVTQVRFPRVHLGPGETRRVVTRVVVQRPALWAPGSPSRT